MLRSGLGGALVALLLAAAPANAQQTDSHLYRVTKSGTLRVCMFPGYYSISFRDPTNGQLVGIDADLSKDLADSLGVKVQYVDTNFGTFAADIQSDKCDIAMFGIGITLKRAQAVAFSHPYLQTGIYAVVRKGGDIKTWADIDKPGHSVAVTLGSYIEPFMRSYLKQAKLVAIAPPATRENELMARHVDAEIVDYPTAVKVTHDFDWATVIEPTTKLMSTPFGYVVAQGDQIWLNYVNLFVDTIKRDGTLEEAAKRNNLGPIVAP
jgi:ABC-type amino acid transport substrate-binding protein